MFNPEVALMSFQTVGEDNEDMRTALSRLPEYKAQHALLARMIPRYGLSYCVTKLTVTRTAHPDVLKSLMFWDKKCFPHKVLEKARW